MCIRFDNDCSEVGHELVGRRRRRHLIHVRFFARCFSRSTSATLRRPTPLPDRRLPCFDLFLTLAPYHLTGDRRRSSTEHKAELSSKARIQALEAKLERMQSLLTEQVTTKEVNRGTDEECAIEPRFYTLMYRFDRRSIGDGVPNVLPIPIQSDLQHFQCMAATDPERLAMNAPDCRMASATMPSAPSDASIQLLRSCLLALHQTSHPEESRSIAGLGAPLSRVGTNSQGKSGAYDHDWTLPTGGTTSRSSFGGTVTPINFTDGPTSGVTRYDPNATDMGFEDLSLQERRHSMDASLLMHASMPNAGGESKTFASRGPRKRIEP